MNKKIKIAISIIIPVLVISSYYLAKSDYQHNNMKIQNKIDIAKMEQNKLNSELQKYPSQHTYAINFNKEFNCLTSKKNNLNIVDVLLNTQKNKIILSEINLITSSMESSYETSIIQGSLIDGYNLSYSDVIKITNKISLNKSFNQVSVILKQKDGGCYYFNNNNKPTITKWLPNNLNISNMTYPIANIKELSSYLNKNGTYKSYIGLNKNEVCSTVYFEEVQ